MAYKDDFVGTTDLADDDINNIISDIRSDSQTDVSSEYDSNNYEGTVADNATVYAENNYEPQFSELISNESQQILQPKKKKKKVVYLPVVIAACVLLVAVLAYGVFVTFIAPSEEGTWSYKSSDGLTYYYTFDSTSDAKIVTMSIGSIDYFGAYETSVTDDSNNIMINIYGGDVSGEYTYTMDGYKIFGNATLTLNSDSDPIVLTQDKRPDIDDILPVDENHKIDSKLVGEWEFSFPEYNVKYSVTFNEDGTMLLNQFDMINYYCTYSAENSKIDFAFFGDEKISKDMEYSFDGDNLVFMELKWSRVTEASKDEA